MKIRKSAIALAVATAFGCSVAAAQTAPVCPIPDTRANVFVGTLDTGVPNVDIDGTGPSTCTVNDRIDTASSYASQQAFIIAVTQAVNAIGALTDVQRAAIIAVAPQFDVRRFRPVKLIGFNDLHGNLEAPGGTFFGVPNALSGGVDYLASYAQAIRAKNPNANFMVHAGDLVGATPLISALFLDEPTIEVMNLLGVNLGADGLGNHEFDKGSAELLRLGRGGCATDPNVLKSPFQTCQGPFGPFAGAKFPLIAANVITASGGFLVPPYIVRTFNGVRVGFIAAVTETTPTVVTPTGVAGLTFQDEADSVNALVGQLRNRGVEAIVMVVHEGGSTSGQSGISGCGTLNGNIVDLVSRLDNAVDLVISGHTHQAYNCTLTNSTGRSIPVTQSGAFGRGLTEIDLWLDTRTRDVVKVDARNVIVDRRNTLIAPDASVAALVSHYKTRASTLASVLIGRISSDVTRTANRACEFQAGDLIAEAQLVATQPSGFGEAVVAFMNTGGVRADFTFAQISGTEQPGELTYGESFTVQPFGNSLVTMTLTGQDIYDVLAQQFTGCPNNQPFNRVMQVSSGFEYTWDNSLGIVPTGVTPTLANCSRIVPGSVKINGVAVDLAQSYRATMNNFMSTGGDGYTVFNRGTNRLGGALDIDALSDFLRGTLTPGTPYTPPALGRILRTADAGTSCPGTR
ncbi:MAG: bifunctional metallophosphatase/5'-nucleotidase [Proteobacteria bacterium]|nr:bifunctional metallophosphatase/5'-nucleotidase [Burkholderiales bacterium]